MITFKFNTKTGIPSFKGLKQEESIPDRIIKTMESYGFRHNADGSWSDMVWGSFDIYYVSEFVPIRLTLWQQGVTVKKLKFRIGFDDCNAACASTIAEAFKRAYNIWNRAGRPINGVTLEAEMKNIFEKESIKSLPIKISEPTLRRYKRKKVDMCNPKEILNRYKQESKKQKHQVDGFTSCRGVAKKLGMAESTLRKVLKEGRKKGNKFGQQVGSFEYYTESDIIFIKKYLKENGYGKNN